MYIGKLRSNLTGEYILYSQIYNTANENAANDDTGGGGGGGGIQ